jgi:ribosomal protein S18 acetylase RimI-like enzyme
MNIETIEYKVNIAKKNDIIYHFNHCDSSFFKSLSERVEISEYSKKIEKLATTFEAWSGKTLIGLIAVYFNDTINRIAFITNVSVVKKFQQKGIASYLLNQSIEYAIKNEFSSIELEVEKQNHKAIRLYKQKNFSETKTINNCLLMTLKLDKINNDDIQRL